MDTQKPDNMPEHWLRLRLVCAKTEVQACGNCRHHGEVIVLMQELGPLLTPRDHTPLEPNGLQRFKHYFEAMAQALQSFQAAAESAGHASVAATPADLAMQCNCHGFHWTCLTLPAVNVLTLLARLTQQLPVTACCQVTSTCFE